METYQYQQYQVNGVPFQICQLLDTNVQDAGDLATIQVIQDHPGPQHVVQEEMVLTLQEGTDAEATFQSVDAETVDAETVVADGESKRLTQKQFLAGNAYVKIQKSGILNPDAVQFIINHYTVYRNDNPSISHNKAVAETARFLGTTVRTVRSAIKDQMGKHPDMKPLPKASDNSSENIYFTELSSSRECVRLIDEKVVLGLAKTFRCTVVIKESSSDKKTHFHRVYKPTNASAKKVVTLGFNGVSYKRVADSDELTKKGDRSIMCQVCQKVLKCEQALTSHMRCHATRSCKFCGQEFKTEGNRLASTLVVNHYQKCPEAKKEKKKLSCKSCNKQFSHRPSLNRHREICSPKCDKCQAQFKTLGVLNSHKCPYDVKPSELPSKSALTKARQKAKMSYDEKIKALHDKMLSPV